MLLSFKNLLEHIKTERSAGWKLLRFLNCFQAFEQLTDVGACDASNNTFEGLLRDSNTPPPPSCRPLRSLFPAALCHPVPRPSPARQLGFESDVVGVV